MGANILSKDPRYSKYKIGRLSYGSPNIEDWNQRGCTLEIGSFCSIAKGVNIYLGGNHHKEWVTTYTLNDQFICNGPRRRSEYWQVASKGGVVIGNDVWIGWDALIMSGVTIGDGAIIGARAVVAKDVPPYAIVVGNPCEIKSKRFSDDQIEKLLEIKWWNWDDAKIQENVELMLSPNIDEFINKHMVTK